MSSSITLGALIAAARKSKGISQAGLSAACDYAYNIVSKWENGQSKPSTSDWEELTHALAPALDLAAAQPLLGKGLAGLVTQERAPAPRIDPDVCRRLRRLRQDVGLTGEQVSVGLGIAPSQVSRMENGLTNPTYVQLRKLVRLYNTTYEYILDGGVLPHENIHQVIEQRDHLRRLVRGIIDPSSAVSLQSQVEADADVRAALG